MPPFPSCKVEAAHLKVGSQWLKLSMLLCLYQRLFTNSNLSVVIAVKEAHYPLSSPPSQGQQMVELGLISTVVPAHPMYF